MNFARSFLFFSIAFFSGVTAFAQAEAWDPKSVCPGNSSPACLCKAYAERALNNDCLNEPYKNGHGNPLVTEEDQKKISDAEKLVSTKKSTAASTCEVNAQVADEGLTQLQEINGVCTQRVDKCSEICATAQPAGNLKVADLAQAKASCDSAKAKKAELESDIAQVQSQRDQAKSCVADVSEKDDDEKEKGDGGGFQMPQMPTANKNSCAENPTSQECQQLVQNCSNPSFAKTNEVCSCFSGGGGAACSTTKQADATEREGLSDSGGSGGDYSGMDGESSTAPAAKSQTAPGGYGAAGGGGMQGMAGGANKAEAPGLLDEPGMINANVLAGRGSGGAGGGSGVPGGSYSNDGNWIPPGMKNRTPSADDVALNLTKRAQLCAPTNQKSLDNFQQIHLRFICTMNLDPK